MSKKSQFIKSVKLAIAGVTLTSGLAACSMFSDKHNCAAKEKNSCSAKMEKNNCSAKEKNSCSAKMEKNSCSAKADKANCAAKKPQ